MAKAGKISKDVLAEFSTEKNKRPFGNIPPRRYYLIACEGEETETNYFEAIKRILPPAMVSRVSITGTGRNTRSLVDYTQKLVDARRKSSALPPYYKIWVVFDRDSFEPSDFDNAISMIESKSTDTEQWQAAWSNEAFELWYILHYLPQSGGAKHRQEYQDILAKQMKRPYEKNAEDMFDLLKPYVVDAIERADTALRLQRGKPYHEQNPATTVHLLVKELLSYLQKQ